MERERGDTRITNDVDSDDRETLIRFKLDNWLTIFSYVIFNMVSLLAFETFFL